MGPGEATAKFVGKGNEQSLPDASWKVSTLEETVVAEPLFKKREDIEDKPFIDAIDEGQNGTGSDVVSEARVQARGDLFAAPADVAPSAKEDNRPPNARPGQDEFSAAGRSAVAARQQLRQLSAVKTGVKPPTLPTPKPEINLHAFGDPLDSLFWKEVWCATAVHNVSRFHRGLRLSDANAG